MLVLLHVRLGLLGFFLTRHIRFPVFPLAQNIQISYIHAVLRILAMKTVLYWIWSLVRFR